MTILPPALSLFFLNERPFADVAFPRWQSWLAITLIGVLVGFDPAARAGTPETPGMPLAAAIGFGLLLIWIGFPLIVAFLKWWMKRGGRWDGQGDLFNLVAASWLVADVLGAGLAIAGVPPWLTLPLWLYSIWVGGNALSGAIPKASLGYSIGGILLSLIPVILLAALLSGGIFFALAALGVITPPAP